MSVKISQFWLDLWEGRRVLDEILADTNRKAGDDQEETGTDKAGTDESQA